ncbi:KTSC domain-containing protein [Rhizobium rhododendri]|uniref:KTSC domain-containing protein n=1 Tax=Rhizobium rhododendri TaxID=2506430 RepID=A0ABY8IRD5_9HYPH|nr:KTSC domain-containing protein [Rhizobium rhododendri]WFS25459.1 KTSC domain-containing protein [Rhizobium rhododendri]
MDAEILTVNFKSRAVRTVHYEFASNRLVVITAHGKTRVYGSIPFELVKAFAEHPTPGVFYEKYLRAALRPQLLSNLLVKFLLLRRIKRVETTSPADVNLTVYS